MLRELEAGMRVYLPRRPLFTTKHNAFMASYETSSTGSKGIWKATFHLDCDELQGDYQG